MELITVETPAKVMHSLEINSPIEAGQQLKAEVGGDELSTVVPAGKRWTVRLNIQVIETDA